MCRLLKPKLKDIYLVPYLWIYKIFCLRNYLRWRA